MEIIIFKIMALVYIATGIGTLTNSLDFVKIMNDFKKSSALSFITGFMSITVGTIVLSYHNVWDKSFDVIITIIGWSAVIKGVIFLAFPRVFDMFDGLYKYKKSIGVFLITIGVLCAYLAVR